MIEHIDIEIDNKFNFRFFKEGDDEWVCKLDTWLVKKAEELFNNHQFKMQKYGPYEDENGQIVIGAKLS